MYAAFFKWAQPGLFCLFRPFLISIIQIEISVNGVIGIRTCDRRMVGTDDTTELWQPPNYAV